jgi:hypothetical protein
MLPKQIESFSLINLQTVITRTTVWRFFTLTLAKKERIDVMCHKQPKFDTD